MWALEILAECGFTHDSSIFPINHDRYGVPGFSRHVQSISTPAGAICEVPVATVRLRNARTAPAGGGGYMRLLPYRYTAAGLRNINIEEVVDIILEKKYLDILEHPKRKNQQIFIILYNDYIHAVPFIVDEADNIIIKTAFPSRNFQKIYMKESK